MTRLTLDQYMSLRAQGLTREQAAEKAGILKSTLRSHLIQWGIVNQDKEAEMLAEWTSARALAHHAEGTEGKAREAGRGERGQRPDQQPVPRPSRFERQVTVTLTEPLMRESLRATGDLAHQLAVRQGWHEDGASFPARVARMHADLSEALLASGEDGTGGRAADALAGVILRALDAAFANDLDVVEALFARLQEGGDDSPQKPPSLPAGGHHVANRTRWEQPLPH